jgi:hypothetical protein
MKNFTIMKHLNWNRIDKFGHTSKQHILKNHTKPCFNKIKQGIFHVKDPINLINDAWKIVLDENIEPYKTKFTDTYIIHMGYTGYTGGLSGQGDKLEYVTIITYSNSNTIITSYPSGRTPIIPYRYFQ